MSVFSVITECSLKLKRLSRISAQKASCDRRLGNKYNRDAKRNLSITNRLVEADLLPPYKVVQKLAISLTISANGEMLW